jgi:betaine-aldehyde dehydrogenase
MLVGGDLVGASDGGTFESIDPSTEDVIAEVPSATLADVERAYQAAAKAQPAWQKLGLDGRRACFEKLGALVAEHHEELALLDAIDSGMPIAAARGDVSSLLPRFRDWPALVLSIKGETLDASPGNLHYTTMEPYGVCGRIIPFNHPAVFAIGKVLIPLIAGNTVLLKPAEQTPLSALRFAELAAEVLPPGTLSILSGGGAVGAAIVAHPQIKRIAFTGSSETAMKIQATAATAGIKNLSLELGGKNALIAFPDVDLDTLIDGAVKGMNFRLSQGQSCGSTSRAFIHRDLYEDFLAGVAERVEKFKIGIACDESTDMGPVVSAAHYARVSGYLEAGKQQGARLVTGGGRPEHLGDKGYYLEPTVFADVDMHMRIASEEIFGPVLSVLPWDNYDDVIDQANAVQFGLTASVWTDDIHLAHRAASQLRAGYVWINNTSNHYWGMPFGGFNNSGLGREEGIDELRSYYETKSVNVIIDDHSRLRARIDRSSGSAG